MFCAVAALQPPGCMGVAKMPLCPLCQTRRQRRVTVFCCSAAAETKWSQPRLLPSLVTFQFFYERPQSDPLRCPSRYASFLHNLEFISVWRAPPHPQTLPVKSKSQRQHEGKDSPFPRISKRFFLSLCVCLSRLCCASHFAAANVRPMPSLAQDKRPAGGILCASSRPQ